MTGVDDMKKIRAGIIGTGTATGISMAHYYGYQSSGTAAVTAVYNEPVSLAEDWCAGNQIEGVKICKTLEEFLDNVDVVSICTPNFTHVEYAKKCLESGKHVICEKPVGTGNGDLKELEEICKKTPLIHMVNFNYRKIPALRYLAGLIGDGKLGDIILYRHTMGGGRLINEAIGYEWRMDRACSGPGSIGDFGPHILDTMLYTLGAKPESIRGCQAIEKIQVKEREYNGMLKAVENDDCTVAQGMVGKETLFTIMTSRVGALGNRLEIVGTRGIAKFSMDQPLRVNLEFRKVGEGFTGNEVCQQTGDSEFEPYWRQNGKVEMAACSSNVADFVRRVAENLKVQTSIIYGIQIEKILGDMDCRAIKY